MSEVLWRVIRIIDVPLKTVFQKNIIHFDVEFQDFKTFLLLGFMGSMMAYCFFNSVYNLVFKWRQEGIFSHK